MRLSLHLPSIVLLIVPVWTTVAQPIIYEQMVVIAPPPVGFSAGAWGDYDADGDFDLILTGSRQPFASPLPFTQLYRNDGDIIVEVVDPESQEAELLQLPATDYVDVLNPALSPLTDTWQSALAWGDYDNDGDLDLAITGLNDTGEASIAIYDNVGGADLLTSRFSFPGVRSGDIAWGDYDNDGDLDIIACGYDTGAEPMTVLYENQVATAASFTRRATTLPNLSACSVDWGDFDGDSDLDLLLTGITNPQQVVSRVYRNDGGGQFVDAAPGLNGLLFATGGWGDYDADGDLDIMLSGARLSPFLLEGVILLYRNDGSTFIDASNRLVGSFENDRTPGRYQGTAAWGDFDNNGYLDFLITGLPGPRGTGALEIYQNGNGSAFIKSANERFSGGLFGDAFWGDYDNDGDLDLFTTGLEPTGEPSTNTLRNRLNFGPSPPTAPLGLQATPEGDTVTFTWEASADAETPAPGLTYNLRVGTTPGGLDVVSPMANLDTGRRHLSQRGNAGHGTQWMLQGLPPGTYFWSVQALDNSFKGSPFAPEGSFTIPAGAQAGMRN